MAEVRTIEIDFDVHKRIELERRSFSESPNAVLRRLLKIGGAASDAGMAAEKDGRPWSGKNVVLPHGTEVRMEYNGRRYTGAILDGRWLVEGKAFSSPSAAAGGVALTKGGQLTRLDGWIYWYAKRPGDTDWIAIRELRR
jgi:hypothetical protein